MFPQDFYKYWINNTLIEIKAGAEREKFTEIWMVFVEDRLFARSWNKSSSGWFGELEKSKVGEIRYADKILKIIGKKIHANDPIHQHINNAYRAKYDQEHNIGYALAISQPEYSDYTIEFTLA